MKKEPPSQNRPSRQVLALGVFPSPVDIIILQDALFVNSFLRKNKKKFFAKKY